MKIILSLFFFALLSPSYLLAQEKCESATELTECYTQLGKAICGENSTLKKCKKLLERKEKENKIVDINFTPYEENYFLPLVHTWSLKQDKGTPKRHDFEFQFQLSVQSNLIHSEDLDFNIFYQQTSFWQTSRDSAPFREHNYSPGFFLKKNSNCAQTLIESCPVTVEFGFQHQSNGLDKNGYGNANVNTAVTSKSWNRVFFNFIYEKEDWYVRQKIWVRLPESAAEDDNPEIVNYYGNQEGYVSHTFKNDNKVSLRQRYYPYSKKGMVELKFTFLLGTSNLKIMVYHFSGFGASLNDLKKYTNKTGVGFSVNI